MSEGKMFVVGFRGGHRRAFRKTLNEATVAWLASGIGEGSRSHRPQIKITRDRKKARAFAKFTAEELAKTLSSPGWGYITVVEPEKEAKVNVED